MCWHGQTLNVCSRLWTKCGPYKYSTKYSVHGLELETFCASFMVNSEVPVGVPKNTSKTVSDYFATLQRREYFEVERAR